MAPERPGGRRPTDVVRGLLTRRTADQPDDPNASSSDDSRGAHRDLEQVIGDCAVYESGRRRPGRLSFPEAVEAARTTSGFVWVGLQQTTADEVHAVARGFGLPDLAVEDAVKAHQRPKLEDYDDMLFVVLKPVRYVDHEEVVEVAEIALFLAPSFAVTVRHGESDVLRRVRHEFNHHDSQFLRYGPAGLLYRAMDLVVDGYEETMRQIDEDVDAIETAVFSAGTDDNSERIYKLKREIAEFRRAVLPLATVLERLARGAVTGVPAEVAPYFRDVHDHLLRTADGIESHDRLLSDVLQAEFARVAARQSEIALQQNEIAVRQNEDMRKISAWAAIGLVPTAIAGIYGMNFVNMPELTWHYGYFIVLGVIATTCGILYALFRRNGWL